MQRYFIDEHNLEENIITSDDVFHLVRVMRAKIGDKIEVCCNKKAYLAEIIDIQTEKVGFSIIEELENINNDIEITLIQGLPKGDKTEEIIMHSTELGIDSIILVEMVRSIAKIDPKKLNNKLERYQKIAKEAAEQSHRNTIPEVEMLYDLKTIDYDYFDLKILLDEEEAKKVEPLYLNKLNLKQKSICFCVGPEGGIDPKERQYLIEKGFIPTALGKNILRTQTASLAFLAMIKYALLD